MRTIQQAIEFGETAMAYQRNRDGMKYRAVDALRFAKDPDIASNMEQFTCRHEWAINEESDRCYCLNCGMDGDA